MTSKAEILEAALMVLRHGEPLTIDAVARRAGLTKPGVVHHFATKEALAVAVVDRVLDRWEEQLLVRAGKDAGPRENLRAYVDYALMGELDGADLALLADARLRNSLSERWASRMNLWFGSTEAESDPSFTSARLIADGAWIDRCLGMFDLSAQKRAAVTAVALGLIDEGART